MKSTLVRRALALVAVLAVAFAGGKAIAGDNQQLPADKTAIAGSGIEDIGPDERHPILQQRMRVSSPADLILGVTAECTILTRLVTGGSTPANGTSTATADGTVQLEIEVDGRKVPVQTAPEQDDGSVTFCNRTYSRTVTDTENDDDGIDQEEDYIRTKAANAFNWLALNVGTEYDNPANGQNVLDIVVYATYTRTNANNTCFSAEGPITCSEAYVGKRTLVIEPVHAANGEQSEPAGAATSGK